MIKCPDCMTTNKKEKMIPLSVIDAKIKEFQEILKYDPITEDRKWIIVSVVIPTLEDLKKEATPSPDLEQKIKDRIKELDYEKTLPHGYTEHECKIIQIELRDLLDELRKLLNAV